MRHGGTGLLDPYALLERVGVLPGWVIADLGCGSLGHFVFPAAYLVGSSGRVYALDVQRAAIRLIEREARAHQYWHVHPVWADIEGRRDVLPSQTADLTLIINALYLARERERWAERAWRITKPGGRLLVVDWHPEARPLGPPLEDRLHPHALRSLFEARGWLTELDIHDAGDHHYGFVFRRPEEDLSASVEFISHPV